MISEFYFKNDAQAITKTWLSAYRILASVNESPFSYSLNMIRIAASWCEVTFRGCFRIPASLQPSYSTVPLRSFLSSFLVCQSRCRRFSLSPRVLLHLTSPPGVPAPPGSPQRSLFSSKVLHLFMFVAAVPNCHSHHVQQAIRRGNNKTYSYIVTFQ